MFRAAHRLSSGALTVFAASGLYTHVVKWIHFPLSLGNGRPLLERPLVAEGGTLRGREMFRQIWPRMRLPRNSRDLLHAANLRHGTDGFTSPPKEGMLRIFSPLKIRQLRPGLNPRS